MATLVLTAVGSAIAGPIGGAIGAMVGQTVDAQIFAPKPRQGPRLGDLSVQTSSYGTQIPKVFGMMRVAGTVIWATDIQEDKSTSGGGKGQPKTISYSYSASFAVVLSGRPTRAVRRIWADGKLLRGAAGDFKTETKYRLYLGSEAQPVDPLIASVEGAGQAPAHRGLAYAVFEDFQLADYGNRIPSLTFEIEADGAAVAIGGIAAALSEGQILDAGTPTVTGYAASGDSVRGAIEALADVVPAGLRDEGAALVMRAGVQTPAELEPGEMGAAGAGRSGGRTEISRRAASGIAAEVTLSYYDVARDYQTGLQRAARGGPAVRGDRRSLAAALTADAAKGFAEQRLADIWAARETAKVHLPWRRGETRAGSCCLLPEQPGTWRVSRWSLEHMVVELELVRVPAGAIATAPAATPGRPGSEPDLVHGPTKLIVLDLPPVGEEALSAPLLVAAAAGSEGWRRAALSVSLDGGGWEERGVTAAPAILGHSVTALGAAGSALWDTRGWVEVELLNDGMWLESRDDQALAGGANAAMLGDELIQFGLVESLGSRRFRLARLLRGRRGTEWAASAHASGEPFVLLEQDRLAPISVASGTIGGAVSVMASGLGDADAPPVVARIIEGRALQPPSPVHLRARRRPGGDIDISWVRRSRVGWSWLSGSDTPMGEEREAYRVILSAGSFRRATEIGGPSYTYSAAQQAADGWSGPLLIEVSQVGTHASSRAAATSVA